MKSLKKIIGLLIVSGLITGIVLYPQSAVTVVQAIWTYLLVVMIAVTLHEWGHFIAMRLLGVNVVQFSIGFGKEIFGFTSKCGTRWSFSMIPLGGFVRPLSEKDPDTAKMITEENQHETLEKARLWKRLVIFSGGIIMNMLTAYVVFSTQGYMYGSLEQINTTVTEVHAESPAEQAGLQVGDKFTHVNGEIVRTYQDLQIALTLNGANESTITVENDGVTRNLKITPNVDKKTGRALMGVSINLEQVRKELNGGESITHGINETHHFVDVTITSIVKLVTGKLGIEAMSGPAGIAKITGETYEYAGMAGLFRFLAALSVLLAVFNALPILPLDGGHFLMGIIEGAKGSPVPDAIQGAFARLGFAALIMLTLYVTVFSDVNKIFG
jgi:regulator of sigma E protease